MLRKSALNRYPDSVLEAIDLSLTGCVLALSVLSEEISGLVKNTNDGAVQMLKKQKLKYLWKDESMNEVLQRLRSQTSALSLLLKALYSASVEQILAIVQAGRGAIEKVRSDVASARQKHPSENYAQSILDVEFDDTKTI